MKISRLFGRGKAPAMPPDKAVPGLSPNVGDVPIAGFVDAVSSVSIGGWCVHLENPGQNLELELLVAGKVVTRIRPFIPRADISQALGRNARAGFRIHVGKELASSILEIKSENKAGSEPDKFVEFQIRPNGHDLFLPASKGIALQLARSDLERIVKGDRIDLQDPFFSRFERLKKAAESATQKDLENQDVRLIAFYLPQFHPFPENNEWWGEGFTEWTNVSKAEPLFPQHYQPHLPADLGYYDLRLSEVRERQAELARDYGIYGFCYHYYWFGGRTLMDGPIRAMLESGKPDFPFCICWANEPWSRRWDGSESELLLPQPHDIDMDERFIVDVMPFLKDQRYIAVNGAPLIVIYRVSLLPDSNELFRRWRLLAASHGIPDLHIVMAETFGLKDPYKFGCDAAVDFPPHRLAVPEISDKVFAADAKNGFKGAVFDYRDVVAADIKRPAANYILYRGIFPSWDNTSRLGPSAHIFHHASPDYYEIWLRSLIDNANQNLPSGQRLVFINAWNEWAEGTHLEPDRKHGRRYLDATRRAISGRADAESALLELETVMGPGNCAVARLTETLRRELNGLKHCNQYMAKQHAEYYYRADFKRAEWMAQPKFDTSQIEWTPDDLNFQLERINQYGSPHIPHELLLDRNEFLDLAGWLFVKEWKSGGSYCFLLAQDDEGRHSVALMRNRFQRPDVESAFPGQVEMPSGFEVSMPLSGLPPGLHDVSIVITDGKRWKGIPCDLSVTIV
jgi:hypothetical protein